MLKKLKYFLNLLRRFRNKKNSKSNISPIPSEIEDSEKIIRAIYSPINLTRNLKNLNNGYFKPQAGRDDISVNRLDFTTPNFLKKLALNFENKENRRNYFGFSLLNAIEIRESKFNIISSPLTEPVENPFHADIKIGHVVTKGKQLPSEISFQIKEMTSKARFYIDPDPAIEIWNGDDLV